MSRVAEHEQVGCEPIRAAVAALRSNSSDLGPPPQVHLQPLGTCQRSVDDQPPAPEERVGEGESVRGVREGREGERESG